MGVVNKALTAAGQLRPEAVDSGGPDRFQMVVGRGEVLSVGQGHRAGFRS
jgi:hypothetical protein